MVLCAQQRDRVGALEGASNMVKRIKGTLTPYEPIEVAVIIAISQGVKRLLKGLPYPYRHVSKCSRDEERPRRGKENRNKKKKRVERQIFEPCPSYSM